MVFTKQEVKVFLYKLDGLTDLQIASKMKVSLETVKSVEESIKKKIGITDKKETSLNSSASIAESNKN